MDIEKLIERLRNAAGGPEGIKMCQDAATFLSTLQSENEKLRAELEHKAGLTMQQANELERRDKLLKEQEAELEQVKHQRDSYRAYYDDLASKPNCNTCADKDCKYRPIPGDTVRANCPLWRGPEEG